MASVDPNLLHVTKYEVLGRLPDLMTLEDGTPVCTLADWECRRGEMYKTAVELQYGTMPPAPEFLEVETLYIGGAVRSYRVTTGRKDAPVSFLMKLVLPTSGNCFPCIVNGDMCFPYYMDREYLAAATDEGVAWVFFDRTELAHDLMGEGRRCGRLYDVYPTYTFGALGAWAWGYSRCVDALEIICAGQENPLIDLSCIAFTGHSRGGKTAALAGVLDQRAAVVNPNETCAGACGCYRIHMEGYCDGIPPSAPRRFTIFCTTSISGWGRIWPPTLTARRSSPSTPTSSRRWSPPASCSYPRRQGIFGPTPWAPG